MQTEKSFTQRQAELSAAKRALLQQRLRQVRRPDAQTQPTDLIGPRPAAETIPLSFAQQRLWFLQQLEPESAAYNEAVVTRFHGPLDLDAFNRAAREFLLRHEVMRSRFPMVDGQVQSVLDPYYHQIFTIPYKDMSDLSEEEVMQQAQAELQRPFDLANELPWRTFLWQLGEQDFLSLTVLHHLISDGWSNAILYREIGQLYQAFASDLPSPLPEPRLHYGDYAYWQHLWLQTPQADAQLRYWQQQLRPPLPLLQLPLDHPRPLFSSLRGSRLPICLDAALSSQLRSLGQRCGATLFMILLSAFFLLLQRYSQQDDLIIGTPIAGRNRPELEDLLGCCVNTLALRVNLAGNPTVLELIERVRQVTLSAYDHQDLPFEKLVEVLQPERSLNRNPLFSVLFVLQNTPISQVSFRDLLMSPVELTNQAAKFDLSLNLSETEQEVRGFLEYASDLFEHATIQRLSQHFLQLLRAMVANPARPIAEISLLTGEEQEQILVCWNDTTVEYDPICLHTLIEAQVERTPHDVAVVFEQTKLTYTELNQRANQLAHYLRGLGVGPEMLVGVCLERSIELVVSLLAILKAGGAYVPLDTNNPPERLAFLLKDAGITVLLSSQGLQAKLPHVEGIRVIFLENARDELARKSTENLHIPLSPAHPAYMIYTSGSTGQPKGVLNTHEAVANRLLWAQATYTLTGADRVLQKTPFSFDVSVWEFFWPLLAGARLVLARPEGQRDSHYLARLIAEQQITLLHFIPSMLSLFLEEPGSERCTSLRGVICSGEALTSDLQQRFFARLPANLYNLYGPTEAAIDVTHWTCKREESSQVVPIGYPIANTQMYVLDSNFRPVPPGVIGELYIGGIGLARGYHCRPELTAERFLPHPFSRQPGARLYKTGDLARYLPDGAIEFIGRNDFQVKIRGNRVEPGEIEAVIRAHPAIQACAVSAHPDASGNLRLVAYIVARAGQTLQSNEAYHYLQERLPDYMIPSVFVLLNALPLTSSGKLDRKALPAPDVSSEIAVTEYTVSGAPQDGRGHRVQVLGSNATEYVAPRTPLEEQLTAIWAEVLSLPRVGIQDNFFAIGGHSLLITQVLARVADRLQVTLPVRTLFKNPTVAGLAEAIEKARERGSELRKQSMVSVSREAFRQKRSALSGRN